MAGVPRLSFGQYEPGSHPVSSPAVRTIDGKGRHLPIRRIAYVAPARLAYSPKPTLRASAPSACGRQLGKAPKCARIAGADARITGTIRAESRPLTRGLTDQTRWSGALLLAHPGGDRRRRGARLDAQLLIDPLEMLLHRPRADGQHVADVAARLAVTDP